MPGNLNRDVGGSDRGDLMARVLDTRMILLHLILGDGKKRVHDSEIPNIKKLRQKFL